MSSFTAHQIEFSHSLASLEVRWQNHRVNVMTVAQFRLPLNFFPALFFALKIQFRSRCLGREIERQHAKRGMVTQQPTWRRDFSYKVHRASLLFFVHNIPFLPLSSTSQPHPFALIERSRVELATYLITLRVSYLSLYTKDHNT